MTIVLDMPAAEYHTHHAVSNSQLSEIARSPAHFRARLDGARVIAETPAMRLGTALHCAVLEPERFAAEYVGAPDFGDGRTKAAKEAKAAFETEHAGKLVLSSDEHEAVLGMSASIASRKTPSFLLGRSIRREASVFWVDAETGIECRARPDALSDDSRVIVDIKTTDDASEGAFERSIAKWRYHVQAAFYLDGVEAATGTRPDAFAFFVVERSAPYACAFYVLDADALNIGQRDYRARLSALKECRANKQWPGYPDELRIVSLPAWAKRESDYNG